MVIVPRSMKILSALAISYADNLIVRSADITLKERKGLFILARKTPLHLGHVRNMAKLTEMGAVIFPPVPTFYHKPQTIQDLIDHTIGNVLDIYVTSSIISSQGESEYIAGGRYLGKVELANG